MTTENTNTPGEIKYENGEFTKVPESPVELNLPAGRDPENSIANTFIPYPRDDNRAIYLSYLACGLSPREATKLTGVDRTTVSWWRSFPEFKKLEESIPTVREDVSKKFIEVEFFRNFMLVLEKDHQVLNRSLGLEADKYKTKIAMTREDQEYLLKMRTFYTPQHLAAMEQIVKGGKGAFDFAQFLSANKDIIMERTDKITIKNANAEVSDEQ